MDRDAKLVLIAWILGIITGAIGLELIGVVTERGREPDIAEYRAVRDFTRDAYVREVDELGMVSHALDGMARGLDEYSRYYDREQSTLLDRETGGRYAGVGAIFRRFEEVRRVVFTLPGGPAREAGLSVGDAILEVDGVAAGGLDDEAFRALLSSTPGEKRVMRVETLGGESRVLEVVPRELVDPSVRKQFMLDEERGIGYIALHSFSRESAGEVQRAWSALEARGARALILDLRGNLGGVLDAAVAIAQRFIPSGVIVSTEGRVEREVFSAEERLATEVGTPLVVLVDGNSASASEVLAGALQDHRVAVLVGMPTYGKGMVQTIRRFPEFGTRAKVTSAYYYSPSRRNFERTAEGRDYGIRPDVEVVIDDRDAARIHAYLARYSPDETERPAIEAWQAELGEPLLDPPPDDAQVRAALALLTGETTAQAGVR